MKNVRGMHLIAAAALVCSSVVSVRAQNSAVKARPYAIDYDNIVVHDGVEKIIGHTTESRRGDGATHSVFYPAPTHPDTPNPKGEIVFRRVDFTDGISAMIVDEVYAKSTRRYAQADVDRQNAESFFSRTGPGCREEGVINEAVEGSDTLFGYAAVRISLLTGRDSLTRELDWRLPEFNCVIG